MNRSRGAFHERVLDAHLTVFYYFKEGNSIQRAMCLLFVWVEFKESLFV